MTELGEEILGIPVRRGAPKGVGGLAEVVRNAAFSTAVGLVQYGVSRQTSERPVDNMPKRGGLFSRLRRSLASALDRRRCASSRGGEPSRVAGCCLPVMGTNDGQDLALLRSPRPCA